MQILDLERNKSTGNKTKRFLDVQPYVASKLISIKATAKHKDKFIDHMRKITANESHRYDDIADTCADAIKLALIDDFFGYNSKTDQKHEEMLQGFKSHSQLIDQARSRLWQF